MRDNRWCCDNEVEATTAVNSIRENKKKRKKNLSKSSGAMESSNEVTKVSLKRVSASLATGEQSDTK